MPSILEQYRIADFLEWHQERKLTLNPHFQRGSVWTPAARVYLIDTILRQLPIPKIYLRTTIDLLSKRSVREVVDGQQRLRAIIDFSENKFLLTKRAAEFEGLKFSTLHEEQQQAFLSYPIAVDQLLNASDDLVLEVFARLNSYSVSLNEPEKRHAKFQGDFKWSVRGASQKWSVFWEKYAVFSIRERVRMEDDSLTAEIYGILLEGVQDGGQSKITALYRKHDRTFGLDNGVPERANAVLRYIADHFAGYLVGTPLLNPPHLLMLFAAVAHAKYGIPAGEMGDKLPARDSLALADDEIARNNLLKLASVIGSNDSPQGFTDFWLASKSSTQRIASRRQRFPEFYRALLPQSLE